MAKYITDVLHFGVLRFSGEDSKKFLQGQTTCHLDQLSPEQGLYGAFCTPKGRMKTTFVLVEQGADILMILDRTQGDYICQQLAPYMAFFKSEVADVSNEMRIYGISDDELSPATKWAVQAEADGLRIQIPSKQGRYWLLASDPVLDAEPMSQSVWQAIDIADGHVWIGEPLREVLLPHDVNLPELGGVSYEKGCYTGQEIVARMHYRGNPKYGLAVLSWTGDDVLPADLYELAEDDQTKRVGTTVSQVAMEGDQHRALVSILKERMTSQQLRLSNGAEGAILCDIEKPHMV